MFIDQKQFSKALRAAALVSKRAPKAVRNTRVEVTEKSVQVLATDGDVWYQRVLSIRKPLYGGEAVPTCRTFTAGSDALINAARKMTSLDSLAPNAKDEPLYGIDPRTNHERVSAWPLPVYLLALVAFSASRDKTRPHLGAVQLSWGNGDLWARATDGHRATRARTKSEYTIPTTVVVPVRAVDIALELFGQRAMIMMRVHEGVVWMGSSDEILVVRSLESEYPSFETVFPQVFTGTASNIQREDAAAAARAIGVFSGRDVDIAFTVGGERVKFSGLPASVSDGMAMCWTPAEIDGAGSTCVNGHYLAEALDHAPNDSVVLSVNALPNPVLHLRAHTVSTLWEHLILPIRGFSH